MPFLGRGPFPMTPDAWIVLGLIALMVTLFVTDKLPPEAIALGGMLVLTLTGVLTLQQAVAGFSNQATLAVAAMLILSAGLQKTGALSALGGALLRLGGRPRMLLLVIMVVVGGISAFVNNTAAVAVLLPLVLATAGRHGTPPSRLLIPLSYASQFGGVCTLIGTSTNLLVNGIAVAAGLPSFTMFEFGQLGLILFGAGTLYLWLLGPWLLPDRRAAGMVERYGLGQYFTELRVMRGSPLAGHRFDAQANPLLAGLELVEIVRDGRHLGDQKNTLIETGDLLLVRGDGHALMSLKGRAGLELNPEFKLRDSMLQGGDLMLAEAVVAPGAPFVGHTLRDLRFAHEHELAVLALQRRGSIVHERLAHAPLETGDILLVLGKRDAVQRLGQDRDLILLGEVNAPKLTRGRVPRALAIMATVVALPALGLLDILPSAMLGCLALWATGCLRTEEVFESVQWRVVVLLAAMIPLGTAIHTTGVAQSLSSQLSQLQGAPPVLALAAVYLLTAVLTEFMSNNATAVLIGPIALGVAEALGISPVPLLVAVAFAASTSFATPVGYQTNAMVYTAGGYRFTDFARIGIPLNLIFMALAVWLIPVFWPF